MYNKIEIIKENKPRKLDNNKKDKKKALLNITVKAIKRFMLFWFTAWKEPTMALKIRLIKIRLGV